MTLTMLSDAERQAAYETWRDKAERADLVAFLQARGHKLKRVGSEWIGPCPRCGGRDRFSINPRERVFNCRSYGGGNYIDAVMHIEDCEFRRAGELLTGEPMPTLGKRKKSEAKPAEPRTSPPPRSDDSESRRSQRVRRNAVELFESGSLIVGTHAAAYLAARGLSVSPSWSFDLRFIERLPYFGYATPDDEEQRDLGEFPAMVAAIRNVRGEIIGAHRTYLDPKEPRKLTPPGDSDRNAAKKVLGKAGGGLIWLSKPAPVLVIGEGIETSRSGYELGIGGADAAVAAAVSLPNLSGGATGTLPHPSIPRRVIPNGEPDVDRPGAMLPPDVREVIILGDGDSDRPTTFAHLMTAGRRWKSEGRTVFIAPAPDGEDWNDVLRRRRSMGE